jgi:hypothetical protein
LQVPPAQPAARSGRVEYVAVEGAGCIPANFQCHESSLILLPKSSTHSPANSLLLFAWMRSFFPLTQPKLKILISDFRLFIGAAFGIFKLKLFVNRVAALVSPQRWCLEF